MADFLRQARAQGGVAPLSPLPDVTTNYNVITTEYVGVSDHPRGRHLPRLDQRAYLRTLARETDALRAGGLKAANTHVLAAAGVPFGAAARLRRTAEHSAHYLRLLGPMDFATQVQDRRATPAAQPFPDAAAALLAAAQDDVVPRSADRLRFLRPRPVATDAATPVHRG